jgi:ubiquinone/menaquinone biosynthesis C-methylase UbiE
MPNKWFYDEFQLPGTDFHSEKEAVSYLERIEKIRDSAAEAALIAKRIGLEKSHKLLDVGCGPALVTVEIAKICREAVGADISDIMLKIASDRAVKHGVSNIRFLKGGFLQGDAISEKYDRIMSQRAFHHVPTFWKQIALLKIRDALNPGGIFYLDDVVFSFEPGEYESQFDAWIESVNKLFGKVNEYTAVNHIVKEYSDFTWTMEGMLERAGFEIVERVQPDKFFAHYVCVKK